MVIEDKIICGVPDTMCPQDNCDNCQVGKNWLAEKLWLDIGAQALKEAETAVKIAEAEHEEDSIEVMYARHVKRAISRHNMMRVTNPNHCPSCGQNIARHVNFCSKCGQRVTW